MPAIETHMRNYKAFIMMLVLAFSLSPCSVKRDVLSVFDIQYFSGLNKVKTTAGTVVSFCDASAERSSSLKAFSKKRLQLKNKISFLSSDVFYNSGNVKITFNQYSGTTSGNSPPKYILFKRLKLHMA
ncbi:hypothetical protein [Chryseobacterium sp. W4I1]|uniref:hypothetical protein n=1 Tax=Chryseobacterium sp. W4I1 TaxID=3042293 RepID=UPI002784E19E|nr:hypothetical protein [Chryseobacterium sp. W4I1]MDQ0782572.1 hypothetical protein [Chryseobacterium sp. W4I1]